MSKPVFWIVEGVIQQGALDALRSLIDEMVTSTQADKPGTIAYEWFVDSGGRSATSSNGIVIQRLR